MTAGVSVRDEESTSTTSHAESPLRSETTRARPGKDTARNGVHTSPIKTGRRPKEERKVGESTERSRRRNTKNQSKKGGGGDGDEYGEDENGFGFSKYLSIVEPFPVEPPPYFTTLPRMTKPAFSDFESKHEELPAYAPTVYKLGILYKKMEWNSPFEMASQRQWKPFIVELNSTQLNFYQCPFREGDPILNKFDVSSSFSSSNSHSLLHPYHHHHLYLKREQGLKAPSAIDPTASYNYNEDNFRSVMTTKTDLKALKFFKSIKALESTKIVRSFTLQYGKIGLAIDYKKKSDVFRGRFETEQFLLKFPSTEAMVEWYNAINLGIDTALDLSRREMPTYRTVPRRRRRRHRNHYRSLNVAMGISLGAHYVLNADQYTKKGSSSQGHSTLKDSIENYRNKDKDESTGLMRFFKKRASSASGSSSSDGLTGIFRKNRSKSTLEGRDGLPSKTVKNGGEVFGSSSPISRKKSEHNDQDIIMLAAGMANSHIDTDFAVEDGIDGEDFEGYDEDELVDEDEDEYELHVNLNDENEEHDSDIDSDMNNENGNDRGTGTNIIINGIGDKPNNLGNNDEEKGINELQKPNGSNSGTRNRSSESSRSTTSFQSTPNRGTTATTTPQSMLTPIQSNTGENCAKTYKLRKYREYIAKPSPHSIKTYTFPAQRKILRDSIRCMVPLVENERWIGQFVLLDVAKNYRPQSREAVDHHFQSLEVLTHVGTVGGNYVHRFQRPLQEWIVTPSGLIPHINPNFDR